MEIWDLHCHLSGVSGNSPEARLAKLLEFADRMTGIRLHPNYHGYKLDEPVRAPGLQHILISEAFL